MAGNSIYTKRSYGLDKNVWMVLFVTIILSVCLLSYRMMEKKGCVPVNFNIKSTEKIDSIDTIYVVDETLAFNANDSSEDITWDFGDKTEKQHGFSVLHRFHSEGNFTVSASTGNGCEDFFKTVTIKKAVPVQTAGAEIAPENVIAGHSTTVAQRVETFFSMIQAKDYQWTCNKIGGIKQGMSVDFVFPVKGTYKLELILDNDKLRRYTKEIIVADSIPPKTAEDYVAPLPDEPLKKNISDEVFKIYLGKVVDGDFTVDNFNEFLPEKGKTPVTLNGKPMDFATACTKLNGMKRRQLGFWKKKVSITSVKQTRGGTEDNTISIEIKHNG